MQITIEPPNQPDIVALINELDAYQGSLYPAESNHLLDLPALMQPNVLFAVARAEDGSALGCGAILLHDGFAEIKRMFVAKLARGSGIAGALLGFLETAAISRGRTRFMLETGIRQQDALRLYERAGYERCRAFEGYVEDPLSVFMRKIASNAPGR